MCLSTDIPLNNTVSTVIQIRNLNLGAVLVYDITDQDSFSKVQIWVKELRC